LLIDRQLGVTDDVCEQDMRDFELNFLFNLSSHMASHGNARRKRCSKVGCRESSAKLDLKEIAAGPIAIEIESGIDGTNPGRNSAGVHASKESLPSCGGLIQTASMEAEIDCKLQSNFS
jgi:hypothetical protein